MQIKKESFITDHGYTIKKFDENNNLIKLNSGYDAYNEKTHYIYDSNNRLMKSKTYCANGYGAVDIEKEKCYLYNNEGYRITEYQTKIIHDSETKRSESCVITADELMRKYPEETDILLSIEEVFVKDKNIELKKYSDFENHIFKNTEFTYEKDKLTSEKVYEINKSERKILWDTTLKYNEEGNIIEKNVLCFLHGEKELIENKKINYSKNSVTEIVSGLNHPGANTFHIKYDYNGNPIEKLGFDGYNDRIIYINNYDYFDHGSIDFINEIAVKKDSFEILSTKKFIYFDS